MSGGNTRGASPELEAVRQGLALSSVPLATTSAPSSVLQRLRASVAGTPRLGRFSAAVAAALGIAPAHAEELLRGIDAGERWEPAPWPGVSLYHLEEHLQGAPILDGALVGFIRVTAGADFPTHEHLGEEQVLVVQGSCSFTDDDVVARPGDLVTRAEGSSHAFTVRPGADLIYLAVVRGGVRFGEVVMRPGSPDL